MNVLFLCTGNSCRSQMAEAFGRTHVARGHRVFSAGTSPVGINPRTFETMAELGFDLAGHHSKDVSEVPVGELDLVVTLCGSADSGCPADLLPVKRVHWDLADPAAAAGTEDEIRAVFRAIREDVQRRVRELLAP